MSLFDLSSVLKVYAITDRKMIFSNNYTIEKAVEMAILGGATIIQIREKEITFEEFLQTAQSVKTITKKYNIPLIINDNLDVAIAADADGVHLGQEDLEKYNHNFTKIRKRIGDDKIIGVSANTIEEAIIAEQNGADYLGVNTPFLKTKYSHNTKLDAKKLSFEDTSNIVNAVKIPCVGIGGVHKETIPLLGGINFVGLAMISAIFEEKDIKKNVKMLKNTIENTLRIHKNNL